MQNKEYKLPNIYQNQAQNEQIHTDNSAQIQLQNIKKQHSRIKISLSVILVILATYCAQIQIQYHGPFVRTVQCFFNFHLLGNESQDIYEAADVIFYRTRQYRLGNEIEEFYKSYLETLKAFYVDSFFYLGKGDVWGRIEKQQNQQQTGNATIMVIYKNHQDNQQNSHKLKYLKSLPFQRSCHQINGHIFLFFSCHINQLQQLFNSTFNTKQFYQHIKIIEIITFDTIMYRSNVVKLQIKVINNFQSSLMMEAKVQTNVVDIRSDQLVKDGVYQNKLGIRKLPEHHFFDTSFQSITWLIFVVNACLFAIELKVIKNINYKIQQNLNLKDIHPLRKKSISEFSFFSDDDPEKPLQTMTYKQKIDVIGRYALIQLLISFAVFFCVKEKGLLCLLCWTKISVILSSTGHKMMIGFLFKRALPTLLRIMVNLLIPLMGFVFFSMLVYKSTRKFEYLQLGFYEYIFNYFQYGIYENFLPISKYGSFYTFTYFLQLFFLVSVGNNILQSILAQQVLKNSNLKGLTEFIENIEVQCPICGCPPKVKKKINIKMKQQNNQQNRSIFKYFNKSQKQVNKSKYQIRIASPQFSPMFHKSQLHKKEFQLKKRQFNQIQRKYSEDDVVCTTPPFSPKNLKKKVKFQIGSQVQINDKYIRKQVILAKKIMAKSQILNKVLAQYNSIILVSSSVNKYFYEQVLKQKMQALKRFEASIN